MAAGLQEMKKAPQSILLDVRTPQEFRGGHIPGARNLPVDRMQDIDSIITDKSTPLYVYCLSGARSHFAASALGRSGYQVTDLGAIGAYAGKLEAT